MPTTAATKIKNISIKKLKSEKTNIIILFLKDLKAYFQMINPITLIDEYTSVKTTIIELFLCPPIIQFWLLKNGITEKTINIK